MVNSPSVASLYKGLNGTYITSGSEYTLWVRHGVASRRLPSMCRVRTEFQSFRITFGKVTSAAGASADRENSGRIQALQEVADVPMFDQA